MKKILFLIFCLNTAYAASSQTFAPLGSFWKCCTTSWAFGTTTPSSYILMDSDTIDGKEIKNVLSDAGDTLKFYINGDTTFVYSSLYSTFTPLYNFSLLVGDTMHFTKKNSVWNGWFGTTEDDYIRFRVDSTGTEVVQGTTYRYYTMVGDTASFQAPMLHILTFTVRERMGTDYDCILPTFNDGLVDVNAPVIFYYSNTQEQNFFGDSAGVCRLSIDENKLWKGNTFPNPVNDVLNISNPKNEDVGIEIIDMSGRIIKTKIILKGNSTTVIPMDDVMAGIYLLKIMLPNNFVIGTKIIKGD